MALVLAKLPTLTPIMFCILTFIIFFDLAYEKMIFKKALVFYHFIFPDDDKAILQ